MSSDLPTYALGATQLAVGTGINVRVTPPAQCNGGFFKALSGGSLQIVQGISATAGYLMDAGEAVSMSGPAVFYLNATAATAVVGVVFTYSQGYQGT